MSNDITSDLVARIASKLYNEGPHSSGPSLQGIPAQPAMTTPTGSPPLHSPHALPAGSPLPATPGFQPPGMSLPNHLPVGAAAPAPFPAQARTVPTPFSQSPTYTTIPGNPAGGSMPSPTKYSSAPAGGISTPPTPMAPMGTPFPATPGFQPPGMSLPNHAPVQATPSTPFPARTAPTPFSQSPTSPTTPGFPAGSPGAAPNQFNAPSHFNQGGGGLPASTPLAAIPRVDNSSGQPAHGYSHGEGYHSTLPHGASNSPTRYSSTSPQASSGNQASTGHAPDAPPSAPSAHNQQYSAGLRNFVQGLRRSNMTDRHSSGGSTSLGSQDNSGHNQHHPLRTSALVPPHGARPFDVNVIREDFPILKQIVNGRPIAWFDNAATTQKPQSVIDAISQFYQNDNSNIHRAAHTLAARATDAYEGAREKVKSFLGASSVNEIVFVRGTTEGINLIANTFGRKFLRPGDEIVLSTLEHHAQIVPWQMIAKEQGAVLRVIPVNDHGEIMMEEYQKILGPRTKVVALAHANNSLGTILPVQEMTAAAKRYGARVVIDGAQSVAHIPVNMQELGADFYVFSGHKIFGPTGIGAVYVKEDLHDILPPWQGGGNMIRNVTFEETSYSPAPAKFEAGTPNIADAVGLGAALDYVNRLGLTNIAAYEHHLLEYGTEQLSRIGGLRLIGTAREKVGVMSFVLPNKRTEEVGKLLDQEGIAVRSGHHCAQPSLRRFGVESTVRPSLSIYNTCEEIDRLVDAVKRIIRMP
jgi:cysteine desulfurase/selenocysteine lyase